MERNEQVPAGQVLEVFGDYVCPFSWLQFREIERLRRELAIRPVVRALELWPLPTPLPTLEALRHEWETEVVPLARALAVTPRFPESRTRTRKAHELTAFARVRGHEEAIHAAIFRARFERGLDIGRIDVLAGIAEAEGLDRTEVRVALDIDQFAHEVDADRERAAGLGVSGLPALVRPGSREGTATMHIGFADAGSLRRWIMNEDETGAE